MSITVPPLSHPLEPLESHLARRALIQRTALEASGLEDGMRSSAQPLGEGAT
jgi:hypothetical protein